MEDFRTRIMRSVSASWTLIFGGLVIYLPAWYLQTQGDVPLHAGGVAVAGALLLSISGRCNGFATAYFTLASALVGAFVACEVRMEMTGYIVIAAVVGTGVSCKFPSIVAAIIAAFAILSALCSGMFILHDQLDHFPQPKLLVSFAAISGVIWWEQVSRQFIAVTAGAKGELEL